MSERHELWKLADALQMDARALNAKIMELRRQLAGLELPDPIDRDCPTCGIRTTGPIGLSEHRYRVHDGPVPETWERLEQLVG